MTSLEADKSLIWHPFTSLMSPIEPILIKSANGVHLQTEDGRQLIDAISSWWVNLHGHSHPAIADAIAQQAKKLEHVIFAGFTHEPAIELAQNLKNILPSSHGKIFFSDNGSTAVEVALKMALQYWHNLGQSRRKRVIALDGAYHGDTFGAMSVGERGPFTKPFHDHLFEVTFLDFPDGTNEESILAHFQREIYKEDVAALIVEPLVQAASGMRIYSAAFLEELFALAHQNDIVCIADEVFTGFGRTGRMMATHYIETQPDITALSKGLTGGFMAMGVTSCTEAILEAFQSPDSARTFYHGHSYTANPLACAAANASFQLLMSPACQNSIQSITTSHARFKASVETNPRIKSARQLGTILAFELQSPQGTSYFSNIRDRLYNFFLERNILLRPLGNIVYILPPYCIREEELNQVYDAISDWLEQASD